MKQQVDMRLFQINDILFIILGKIYLVFQRRIKCFFELYIYEFYFKFFMNEEFIRKVSGFILI